VDHYSWNFGPPDQFFSPDQNFCDRSLVLSDIMKSCLVMPERLNPFPALVSEASPLPQCGSGLARKTIPPHDVMTSPVVPTHAIYRLMVEWVFSQPEARHHLAAMTTTINDAIKRQRKEAAKSESQPPRLRGSCNFGSAI